MSNEPCLFASRPSTLHRVNASVACGPRPGVGRWRPVHGRDLPAHVLLSRRVLICGALHLRSMGRPAPKSADYMTMRLA